MGLITDIHPRFFSTESGAPFDVCTSCGRPLLDPPTPYLVEKAVRRYKQFNTEDTIFEYAICVPCYQEIVATYSKQSLASLDGYFTEKVPLLARRERLQKSPWEIDAWMDRCVITGDAKEGLEEYQIVGQFSGRRMIVQDFPMLIGENAIHEIAGLLSSQTLDEMNGFSRRFFGPPPEVERILDRPFLMI